MKFEIKHRLTGAIRFSLETDSFRSCVEVAVKSRANLYGANLRDADLSDADLSGANLRDADLSDADLSDANLSGANLSRANLSDAYLSRANLSRANLYGANLSDANLSRAYLSDASLYGAYLYGANLSRANLSRANLSRANLYGANLRDADLSDAYLSDAERKKLSLVGERPTLQLGPLGSRCAYLQAFLTDAGVYIRAGCFWGTLAAFTKAVKETHGTSVHGKEYAAAIAMIKAHATLWTPKKEKRA